MIKEKLGRLDSFWDVRGAEKSLESSLDLKIQEYEKAITLGKRLIGMKSQPGYEDLVRAIGDLEAQANIKLLSSDRPEEMWRLQGRTNALKDIRSIMVNTENRISELDIQLAELQNQRSAIVRPDVKTTQE